ncbi:hypothetical protein C8R26_101173 [Nitrosomonas oligotropha]|uniref:site-specific DNA-methyltransferase (adenine-specific) n=2 Tax=Nitrosomonas oligotropha TaxID=42354 RepID=A0A2T5I4W1_9PROT|nr:hypothetical protein C8R26_101173 [Nitrosomonas oligotropha]
MLDYVTCWYRKATGYIAAHPAIRVAFVSTNSITQGEQVGVLWPDLLRHGVHLHFAHRTFQWSSEASGKAAVHCVIIGFGLQEAAQKTIFEYENIQGEAHAIAARNINPYLVDAPNIIAEGRMQPLSASRPLANGSIPADGGHLILEPADKDTLIASEPIAEKWLRPYLGAEGFIHNQYRYCLWLLNCPPNELRLMPAVLQRVEAVREFRLKSSKAATRDKAATPTRFTENRQPVDGIYLALPRTSSENRFYIPIGFLSSEVIAANDLQIVPDAGLYEFGILTSVMHMAWMKITSGRLESRYRYSAKYTYNTLPWPEPSDTQRQTIETAAQAVLDARALFPNATLADLYDPLAMPPELVRAHQTLDRAVDAAYGKKSFASEAERVAFLFERYQTITSLLPVAATRKPGKKTAKQPDHDPLP